MCWPSSAAASSTPCAPIRRPNARRVKAAAAELPAQSGHRHRNGDHRTGHRRGAGLHARRQGRADRWWSARSSARHPRALGPATDAERAAVQALSPVATKYDTAIDRESAYEILTGREASGAPRTRTRRTAPKPPRPKPRSARKRSHEGGGRQPRAMPAARARRHAARPAARKIDPPDAGRGRYPAPSCARRRANSPSSCSAECSATGSARRHVREVHPDGDLGGGRGLLPAADGNPRGRRPSPSRRRCAWRRCMRVG